MRGLLRFVAAALLAFAAAASAFAQDVLPVPPLAGRVLDETGTLSPAQSDALEAKLAAIEAAHGSQIVVLLVPSTLPEDIAAYAQRVGDAWKIGRRDVGDGLLLLVAKDDRKIRIEVAKALEGAVPDLAARQIITDTITPAFRKGDFAGGLNAGVDALAARIAGEMLPAPSSTSAQARGLLKGFDIADLAIFLFVAVPVLAGVARGVFGGKLGSLATGGAVGAVAFWITTSVLVAAVAGVVALVVAALGGLGGAGGTRIGSGRRSGSSGSSSVGGWSSGGSSDWSSSSSDSFSSGGGGDFGGGGASGDW